MSTPTPEQVEAAKDLLTANGYVAVKEKSYRAAQERQRIAERLREAAEDNTEGVRAWAVNCCDEERRLRERLTFVYGVARAHGATVEELRGNTGERVDAVVSSLQDRIRRVAEKVTDPDLHQRLVQLLLVEEASK